MNGETPRKRLRKRLASGPVIIAPGIYDAYGARLVEQAGFEAAYMTGNGVSASLLGRPDVGLVDLTLVTGHARRVASCVDIPLICDADTGYGNAVNVRHAVREFEAAGVAAIHIEDQETPKRCGHLPGARPVIGLSEAVGKVEAALAARRDPDFIIIARTDVASGEGVPAAIERAKAFHEAGADVLFVELKNSPTIVEDMKRVTQSVDAPFLVNIDGGGTLGALAVPEIEALGFRIAIYPGLERYAAGYAVKETLSALKRDGSTKAVRERMLTMQQYNQVLGLADVEEWEKKYLR
ncbi:MAG: isocitrate lyase/PEP mutase family protein [Betaproteobacteria bacterium]|nr:isocitrate lyase/PEP mutase family protein [Betaproteobacteria bacterium]